MRSRFPRWTAAAAATVFSLASMLPQGAAAQQPPFCTFQNGFAYVDEALGPDVVGTCVENEHFNVFNGNVEQRTTNGLLFWRKCDNTTAFTDGYLTWLNGPSGLQSRLAAGPPLDWEPIDPSTQTCGSPLVATQPPLAVTPAPTPTPAPAVNACSNYRNADLSNLNKQGLDLTCGDFYHAKLIGTDFTAANLTRALLEQADLTRAIFYQADLTRAVLIDATSTGSATTPGPSFLQAHMSDTSLSFAKLWFSDFRGADLRRADLTRASLTGSTLQGADLRGANLSQANFTDTDLTGANLCGANTTGTNFTKAIGLHTACL